jgi:subtilisin family serine protease
MLEARALISRMRVFLPIIPIALLLVASCTARGPALPDRNGEVLAGTTASAVVVEAAVRDLLASDRVVPGELSLKLVEGAEIDPILDQWNLTLIEYLDFIDFYHLAVNDGGDLAGIVASLRGDPRVAVAEPVYRTYMSQLRVTPNDAYFTTGDQWYLENMDVPEAWVIEPGDPSIEDVPIVNDVVVAILDTGVDLTHEDINTDDPENIGDNEKIFPGNDFVNGDSNPADDNGHGTMVAGIIGARTDNDVGISSIGWNPRLIPIKVLDSEGVGNGVLTAKGINHAVQTFKDAQEKADPYDKTFWVFDNPFNARLIINMSFTYETPNTLGPSQMELTAVNYAIAHGHLLVAAAGDGARPLNDGSTSVYPASFPGVIAVGCTDQANALSPDTNTLPLSADPATANFFVAPGVDIISTYPTALSDGYAVGTGTSFSAACLSGVAALIWAQFPFLSPGEVIETLADGANSDIVGTLGADYVSGHGLINAFDSLQRSFTPDPSNDPMIVRAFTNPILHGDIVFVVRSKYDLLGATETALENPWDPFSPFVNNGYPFNYLIGWDFDLDQVIDYQFPYVYYLDTYYWRHEIEIGQIDDATYIGRIHFPQDLTLDITSNPHPMGQLVIQFIGVPFNRKFDTSLPQTVAAATTIQINEFNYDMPD